MAIFYRGRRSQDGSPIVGRWDDSPPAEPKRSPLSPRFDLRNHSPDGFEWGYGGSGPAQLALAMLADACGDSELATRHYQDFKFQRIAGLPRDEEWEIAQADILAWLKARKAAA